MKKYISILILILVLSCVSACPAFAQFTTVTATITDPTGVPYAGAVMTAVLVPSTSGSYSLSGKPYSGSVGPVTLDSTGKFSVNFGDVTLITPGSPQWQITIDSAAATLQPPLGTGPQSFTYTSTGTTISGSFVVNLTSTLSPLAPKLTQFAAGAGIVSYNLISDLFQRSGTGLGASYTDWNNSWNPGSGAASGSTQDGFYDVTAFTANVGGKALSPTEYVKGSVIKPFNGPGGNYIGVSARINGTPGTTTNAYSCLDSPTTFYLVKATYTSSSTTNTVLASTAVTPLTDGDTIEMWVVGQTITCFFNRSSVPPGALLQCNDPSYTTGPVGVATQEPTSGTKGTLGSLTVINATASVGTTINIVVDGGDDAVTGGEPGSWADIIGTSIQNSNVMNVSVDSKGLGTVLATGSGCGNIETMIATGTTVVDPLFVPGIRNVLVIQAGSQDIASGGPSVATTYGYLTTYVAARHAAGWKVVVVPEVSNSISNGLWDTKIQAYNQLIFANSAGADAVVPLPQTLIGTHAYLNTNLFSQVHPTILGQKIIADLVSQTIRQLP